MSYGRHVEEMAHTIGCLFWLLMGTLVLAGVAIVVLGVFE
jgi:Tfp pilus assembly protein PilN